MSRCQMWKDLFQTSVEVGSLPQEQRMLRNFRITQMYHVIGVEFASLVDFWPSASVNKTQGNWPTIATWASNSVGYGIRGKALDQFMDAFLDYIHANNSTRKFGDELVKLADLLMGGWLKRASEALGTGNQKVFQEIGYHFSRYGLAFCNATTFDDALYEEFRSNFTANQTVLAQGFDAIYQAHFNTSLSYKARAELMLLSNLRTGLDEQTRLQEPLENACPPPIKIGNSSLNLCVPFTSMMMNLVMPTQILWVGKDVPARPWDGRDFGPDLTGLENADVIGLLHQFGDPLDSENGTAAHNWLSLHERMHYVAPLFRSRQDSVYNTCNPFSKDELEAIWSGDSFDTDAVCEADCCTRNGMLKPHFPPLVHHD